MYELENEMQRRGDIAGFHLWSIREFGERQITVDDLVGPAVDHAYRLTVGDYVRVNYPGLSASDQKKMREVWNEAVMSSHNEFQKEREL